jgi:hypothetical protein
MHVAVRKGDQALDLSHASACLSTGCMRHTITKPLSAEGQRDPIRTALVFLKKLRAALYKEGREIENTS